MHSCHVKLKVPVHNYCAVEGNKIITEFRDFCIISSEHIISTFHGDDVFIINLFFLQLGPFDKEINCATNESYIGFSILKGYRIVLCIIGCVLSLQNRKFKTLDLRECKEVGLATYAFLFTVVVEVATIIAVQDSMILATLLSLEMQAAATLLLLILFVPKVC